MAVTPKKVPENVRAYSLASLVKYDKDQQFSRIKLSTTLLKAVRQTITKQSDNRYAISYNALVTYALVSLLPEKDRKIIFREIADQSRFAFIAELHHQQMATSQAKTTLSHANMHQLETELSDTNTLLNAILVGTSWLVQNRMGLFKGTFAKDSQDVYRNLRADDLKAVIEEVISAGINESDRQNQKRFS